MKTAVLKSEGKIELEERATPIPGEGEIVIRIRAALTCGTDLKAFRRGHPQIPFPSVLGHEFSGDVSAVGAGFSAYRTGDAVMAVHSAPCGNCHFCKKGESNLCESVMKTKVLGAFAEYIKLPAHIVKQNLFLKPENVSYEKAALLEPLSCVVHSFDKSGFREGSSVLVIGTGPIGIMHLIMAGKLGASKIVAVGRSSYRVSIASLFCDELFDAEDDGLKEKLMESSGGFGFDHVFECTGYPNVWEMSMGYVRKGGKITLFGGCPSGTAVKYDTARIHYDEISLTGVFHFTPDDVKNAYEIIKSDDGTLDRLITHHFRLDDIKKVFDLLKAGNCLKISVTNEAPQDDRG